MMIVLRGVGSASRRPLSAKVLGYMLSTSIPKRINRGLNLNNISVGDGPFSDGNGPPARRGN
jgi:hypothetical protein